ncbi:MAG: hypothetical protein J7L89_05050 [Bacteroidales bacterium]|nr:hypothetical protein [Bacteroidales bacterium]
MTTHTINSASGWIRKPTFVAGRIIKSHGIQGGMVLRLENKVREMKDVPEWIFIILEGRPVPFKLRREEVFLKDTQHLVVALERWETPGSVTRFLNAPAWFEGTWSDWFETATEEPKKLTGYKVYDEISRSSGEVTDHLNITANPLIEIVLNQKTVLLPAVPEYLLETDYRNRTIRVRIPPELFNL